jgi:hypothetical protein
MEQKFDVHPRAELKLDGRRITRTDVTGDWGMLLRWCIYRDGKLIATPPARAESSYEHLDKTPGNYEIVLETWKYVDYKKDAKGEFTNSKFVEISNKVSYKI